MKAKVRVLTSLAFMLVLAAGYLWRPGAGQAQESGPTPTPTVITEAEVNIAPASAELTLADWGYEDVILVGPYGYAVYDIGLPLHWEMLPGGTIELKINFTVAQSGTVTTEPGAATLGAFVAYANLRVALNDAFIFETELNAQGQQSLLIPIPDEWPQPAAERDRLEVFFYVYGPCQSILYNSLTVYKETALTLFYDPKSLALDLADYPSPFYQRTFLPSGVLMVLPAQAASQEVEAGMAIAAGIGSASGNRVVITTTTDLEWDAGLPFTEHSLIIGTPGSNRLIPYLNDNYEIPVPLRTRQYELTTSGPDAAEPGSNVQYRIQLNNPTAGPAEQLSLRSWLPEGAGNATCQPECRVDEGQAIWGVGSLAAGASAEYSLAFDIPADASARAIYLTTELLQDQEPVNVSTLQTELQKGAQANTITSQPAGDQFFVLEGQAVAETDGVIQVLPSPWQTGKALLVATGVTGEGIYKAGRALATSANFPGMLGQAAIVREVREGEKAPESQAQDLTLAELGYEDLVVTGTGTKEIYYSFDLPMGWALTKEAEVRLLFSHSPLLDPEQSAITLFFNGDPIASVALDEQNTIAGELVGPLPSGNALPGRANTILVRVIMQLEDPCADPESSSAWLRLDSESSLHLTHVEQGVAGYMDMDYWPMPFTASRDLSDVAFSLPASPSDNEYTDAMRLSSYLGASSRGDNFRPAVALGEVQGVDPAGYHWIVIGRPTRNPLLQSVNADLPQPFAPGTDGIQQQVDNVVLRLPSELDLGYLQSILSPWDEDKVLLVVTGTSDAGVERAAKMLVNSERLWELKGNLALLRDDQILSTDTRGLTPSGQLTAIATSLPEAEVVGTATPAAPAGPTQAPGGEEPASQPAPYSERFPALVPAIVILGILVILVVLVVVFLRSRKSKDKS